MTHYSSSWREENDPPPSRPSLTVIERQPLMACPACAHFKIIDLHRMLLMGGLAFAGRLTPLVLIAGLFLGTAVAPILLGVLVIGFILWYVTQTATIDKYRCHDCGFQFTFATEQDDQASVAQSSSEGTEESLGSVLHPWWNER